MEHMLNTYNEHPINFNPHIYETPTYLEHLHMATA